MRHHLLALLCLTALAGAHAGSCTDVKVLGCFQDSASKRVLPHTASMHQSFNSYEACAALCVSQDVKYNGTDGVFGVEYTSQCFCGTTSTFVNRVAAPMSDCNDRCPGNSTQHCGGSDRILVYQATCSAGPPPVPPPPAPPQYHGCLSPNATSLPYCNIDLSFEDRVADLLGRLNLTEKIWLLGPGSDSSASATCGVTTKPVPRIGLPEYHVLIETNTGVSTSCIAGRCPSSFVGPLAMASTFNRTAWFVKGDVISTEFRVANNYNTGVGLTGYGPNINTVKDPRYGRNSELSGEDPYLSGEVAVGEMLGMQQMSKPVNGRSYQKMLGSMKHYTAYSVETHRFEFKAPVSLYTLWDSNLPQYEAGFTRGNAAGAMCSYFAPNGTSCCGNGYLLNTIVRSMWNRSDAFFMSDCSAVGNFVKNGYAANDTDASAKAMNAGLNVYGGWGDDLWEQGYLAEAIQMGMTSEADVDTAATQFLMAHMKAGRFDPLDLQSEWTSLNASHFNSTEHQAAVLDTANQGLVLLKNDKDTLPLSPGLKLAVVGPFVGQRQGLFSDYAPKSQCVDGSYNCVMSIDEALTFANVGGTTTATTGVDMTGASTSGIPAAVEAVKAADATVVLLGIDRTIEHEGIDRGSTELPGLQSNFTLQVLAAANGKPVTVVLCNGGVLTIDDLAGPVPAIIEAFNPNQRGAEAIASHVFGTENRWGKLPVTVYTTAQAAAMDLQNMSFAGQKRSYRYITSPPLWPFGHGLSYTTFGLTCSQTGATTATAATGANLTFVCQIQNTGHRDGDEVIQVYNQPGDDVRTLVGGAHPVPNKKLIDFERVGPVSPGATASVTFSLPASRLSLVTADGSSTVYPGTYNVVFSTGGTAADVSIPVKMQ